MEKRDHTFYYNQPFELESGKILPGFQLRYTTLGVLTRQPSNVVWVCHALTGSSDFTAWWSELLSGDSPFDPEKHFIICANALGGCYGSTGPLSTNPDTGNPYFHNFPMLTNRDVVRAFDLLREHLQVPNVHTLIGGSLGGQQLLEWAIFRPEVFKHIIPIGCNAFHSPWGIAFNEAQRLAIEADPTWKQNHDRAGSEGLKAARAIAMLSYRHYNGFALRQPEKSADVLDNFRAATYQRYQGEKLVQRFNAFTYWTLSKMMDNHHVGRGRPSLEQALSLIQAKTLLIGIDSDILFPLSEQEFLNTHIPGSTFNVVSSQYGHDGFLVEYDQIKNIIKHFLQNSLRRLAV
jgi:homoserine O-acetyltransferase/O-succinyltransferase